MKRFLLCVVGLRAGAAFASCAGKALRGPCRPERRMRLVKGHGIPFVRELEGFENRFSFCSGTGRLRESVLVLFGNRKASRIGSRFIRELESLGGFRLFRVCGAGCGRRSVGIATRGGLQGASSARCLPTAIGEVRQKTPGRRRGGPCRLTPFDQFRNGVLKPG